MDISSYHGVMVFAEQRNGHIQKVTFELLGAGRAIADKLAEPLFAVLLGHQLTTQHSADLIAHGADQVIVVDHPYLADYRTEPYTKALAQIIDQVKPCIGLVGATTLGRDLAPRASARVKTGLTADCTALEMEDGSRNLLMTRPAFGGNIMATIICPEHRPQMATVRPGVMRKLARDEARQGEVTTFDVAFHEEDLSVEILETVIEQATLKNIEEASVLVSGGRGMGNAENFDQLRKLATSLGGMVAASRGAVEAGWVPQDRQVGQTGKTVRPDLYLACGISGMIQHVAGMEESGYIVAVNKKADAPIFEHADLGIVTDVNRLVPALAEELRKRSGE
ncbi:MAG: electron transfer flavoprotein subunit alpha/FixB family protein [Firmicutes bacterium]|nr:electron transfer flavoprotein subunit alpha/FixB family protein [Bacillota bacterium]